MPAPWLFLLRLFLGVSWILPLFAVGVILLSHRNGDKFPKAQAALALSTALMGVCSIVAEAFRRTEEPALAATFWWIGQGVICFGAWWFALYLWGIRHPSDLRKFWPFGK